MFSTSHTNLYYLYALVIDYNPHMMKYNTVAAGFITGFLYTSADDHGSRDARSALEMREPH